MIRKAYGIVCHGGAGTIVDKEASAEGLVPALEAGYEVLTHNGTALDAVVEAVRVLEDNPVFNCGTGSSLTLDGRAEMDASVMTHDGRFGGVGCIAGVRNPVLVARKVLEETDHMLMCGEGAQAFARKLGFEEYDPVTPRAKLRLKKLLEKGESPYFPKFKQMLKLGTVGAAALDKWGRLAAATSSGGINGRLRGRVGDSALPGAGTFAGLRGAASCTGHGEVIIRLMLARDVVRNMEKMSAQVAATMSLAEPGRRRELVGLVGIDVNGAVCYAHTTPDMSYGHKVWDRLFLFTQEKRTKGTADLKRLLQEQPGDAG